MSVVGIEYKELSKKKGMGYKNVHVSYNRGKDNRVFDSGNFVKDWYDYRKFMILELSDKEHAFCSSSSVDHFIMDGAPFDSAYLVTDDDGNAELFYGDEFYDKGIEFFVEKGTKPTWKELKETCK